MPTETKISTKIHSFIIYIVSKEERGKHEFQGWTDIDVPGCSVRGKAEGFQ